MAEAVRGRPFFELTQFPGRAPNGRRRVQARDTAVEGRKNATWAVEPSSARDSGVAPRLATALHDAGAVSPVLHKHFTSLRFTTQEEPCFLVP